MTEGLSSLDFSSRIAGWRSPLLIRCRISRTPPSRVTTTAAWRSPKPPAARAPQGPVSVRSPCPRTTTNGPPPTAVSERWNTLKPVRALNLPAVETSLVHLAGQCWFESWTSGVFRAFLRTWLCFGQKVDLCVWGQKQAQQGLRLAHQQALNHNSKSFLMTLSHKCAN